MKNYKKIAYILIILSLANFCVNIGFKTKAQKKYLNLDNVFFQVNMEEVQENKIENLRELCVPFTYFDEATDVQLQKIILLLQSGDVLKKDELTQEVHQMQMLLRTRQQQLLMSFDYLLYCSLLLFLIAVVTIIFDLMIAKNKADKIQTANEEQIKFSRDLHDGVAQDLAALKIYLEKNDDERSEFYAAHALSEVRFLIDSMHRDLSEPLSEAIKETLSDFENNFHITTRLMLVSENLEKISAKNQIELFRILQEALSNIGRHANATEVTVQLTEVGDDLKFNIKDNGVGFDVEMLNQIQHDGDSCHPELDSGSHPKKHYGVKNIEERVHALGGTVQFINNGGTTIAITIKDFVR